MRPDIYIDSVIDRCDALRRAGLWPKEQVVRTRAWLDNFPDQDRVVAATLLEHFQYVNEEVTRTLLAAAYGSLLDHIPKGKKAATPEVFAAELSDAVFTPVEGEDPNVTDSGNFICRLARQELGIPEERLRSPEQALQHAKQGRPVVFLDDFVGSGDQFLETWQRKYDRATHTSFQTSFRTRSFPAAVVTAVSSAMGQSNLRKHAPEVAFAAAHVLGSANKWHKIDPRGQHPLNNVQPAIQSFLARYSKKLQPNESYMKSRGFRTFGYKNGGLMLAFSHSVPDATLPVFWSPGPDDWVPLLERA